MAVLTREPGTRAATARASARFALMLRSLAGMGTSQHGPLTNAAIAGAATSMDSRLATLRA